MIKDDVATADMIEKSVWIAARQETVWKSLVDSGVFASWFNAKIDGPFEVGRTAPALCGYTGSTYWFRPVEIRPMSRFSFDWPAREGSVSADADNVLTTRVTFDIVPEGEGTRVTVVETGFAALPADLAERTYPQNTKGWAFQMENLRKHVEA